MERLQPLLVLLHGEAVILKGQHGQQSLLTAQDTSAEVTGMRSGANVQGVRGVASRTEPGAASASSASEGAAGKVASSITSSIGAP